MPSTPASIRLELLGPAHLFQEGAEDRREIRSVLRQPKRFAFFVYLAVARPGEFHRRASLLSLFWPESTEDQARTALRQTLSYLRSSIGTDAIETRGRSEIRVDPGRVSCDQLEFEDHLEAGRPGRALELYRGPFLKGFHMAGSAEFQMWMDIERDRLRRLASGAAWIHARRLEDEGRRDEARRWARRSVDLAPYDERTVRRFITLLNRLGERGMALLEYRRLKERLRRELGVAPSPETMELVQRVRDRERPRWRFPLSRRPLDVTRPGLAPD